MHLPYRPIALGVVAKMVFQVAHHPRPRTFRQHRRCKGQVAGATFLAHQRIGDRGKEMAAAGLCPLKQNARKEQDNEAQCNGAEGNLHGDAFHVVVFLFAYWLIM